LARVIQYVWLGRIRVEEDNTEALGLGEGWSGEWVLEAEGTKEGTETLVNAMERDGQVKEWEIVEEKCGPKKLWLRCGFFLRRLAILLMTVELFRNRGDIDHL
jgi:hypothetical protein